MRYTRTNTDATVSIPNSSGRLVSYVLSTSAVARDNHTIATSGWQLDDYRKNPVFCWSHQTDNLPIGRMVDIGTVGDQLRGTVEYADADTNPFADQCFRLVKGGFLNAVSVSWDPLKWSYTKDRSRPGGIDFTQQSLLEVSQCSVPCLVDALVTARAAGMDTGAALRWAEQVLDGSGRVSIPRVELERLRRAARMPAAPRRNSLRSFAKLNTRADREKFLRLMVFEDARKGLAPVPACMMPCRSRYEREAVVAFYQKTQARAETVAARPTAPAPVKTRSLFERQIRAATLSRDPLKR